MDWTAFLTREVADTYKAAYGLLDLVEDAHLGWRPASGENWMTVGQLLTHMTTSCGFCAHAFVHNSWGELGEMSDEEMLPGAAKMPSAESVASARALLVKDEAVSLAAIATAGAARLAEEKVGAPWNPEERLLGVQLKFCVDHLSNHKAQLFYYLKLLGKAVNTGHFYGMSDA